jgi:hypothetical protein
LYLLLTRPDIHIAVSEVARFQDAPAEIHWNAVKRIIKYLKGTQDVGITIGGADLKVLAYSDANLGEGQDSRSISGGLAYQYGLARSKR